MRWNDCVPVILNGEKTDYGPEAARAFAKYRHSSAHENVWYDTIGNVCFGSQQDYFSDRQEHSFLTQPSHFLNNSIWGIPYIERYFSHSMGANYSTSTEFVYQNHETLSKYKGSSLLIIGAGPSTNQVIWQNIGVDYTWSCNHFFKHPILQTYPTDMFAIGNEVDTSLSNQDLHNYMLRFPKSIACFETTNRDARALKKFKEMYPQRCFYAHTRYRSKIGVIPRLICLGVFLGVSKIFFVGMDGLPSAITPHAFEPGKKPKGSPTFNDSYNRFRRQFVTFWDYILNYLHPTVDFQNLGEGVATNLTTDISRQKFPLKEEL